MNTEKRGEKKHTRALILVTNGRGIGFESIIEIFFICYLICLFKNLHHIQTLSYTFHLVSDFVVSKWAKYRELLFMERPIEAHFL